MAVTLEEIAQQAGVSRSTVSRALHDDARISEKTKTRVLSVADRLGYVPNYIAQSLSNNRTKTIGMVITHPSNPFVWRVIEGVELAAHEQGYSVFLSTARNDRNRESEVMQAFLRRRVDGIIITSSHMRHFYHQRSFDIDTPIVLINEQFPDSDFRSVANDDYEGARLATRYLVSLGHRSIGYISSADRPKSNKRRYDGYVNVMMESDLEPLSEFQTNAAALTDLETGFNAAEAVLQSGLTAVFCYNDRIALGLLAKLYRRGISVPDDLSVLGFDDIDEAPYAVPALTTIRQPMVQLGYTAIEMLTRLLNGDRVENQVLGCELIVRESTRRVSA